MYVMLTVSITITNLNIIVQALEMACVTSFQISGKDINSLKPNSINHVSLLYKKQTNKKNILRLLRVNNPVMSPH